MGFPERKGFDEKRLRKGDFSDKPSREVIAFLQAWLFVGVLKEVLEPYGFNVDVEDFVRENENGERVITTVHLPKYMWYWFASETPSAYLEDSIHMPRIKPFLEWLNSIINDLVRLDRVSPLFPDFTLASNSPGSTNEFSHNPWDKILLSIVLLGQHIDAAFQQLHESLCNEPRTSSGRKNWEFTRLGYNLLTEAGWCLGEISNFRQSTPNVACLYYISFFDRKSLGRDHSKCSTEQCIANNINDAQYVVRHVDNTCNGCCSHIVVEDQGETNGPITTALLGGNIPTISVVMDNETRKHKVVVTTHLPTMEIRRYVAISHVWSDGLGNPRRNSLPTCQLLRLQKLVNDMYDSNDGQVNFWIDTICVPLEPLARKLAIIRMAKTYEGADKVLVLDSSLQNVSSHNPSEELLMRIRCTIWGQRLWTLQEGMLANDLYFQFRDGLIQPENFMDPFLTCNSPGRLAFEYFGEFEKSLASPLLTRIVRAVALDEDAPQTFKSFTERLLDFPNQDDENLNIMLTPQSPLRPVFYFGMGFYNRLRLRNGLGRKALGSVALALFGRTSSKIEDETLCIGPLLGLDVSSLVHKPPEERMKILLTLIGEFPQAIIFSLSPRLCDEGYRWAPRTFLNLPMAGILTIERPARLTNSGLIVTFPGLSILKGHKFGQEKELVIDAATDSKRGIMQPLRYRIRLVEGIESKGWNVPDDVNLALIYHHKPACAGILISWDNEIDEVIGGTFLANVRVEIDDPASAESLCVLRGRRYTPYQQWCLR
jgi:hypothetical protein